MSAGPELVYTPPEGFSGRDEFTYTADDGECSQPAVVSVVVDGSALFVTQYDDPAVLSTADAQVLARMTEGLGLSVHTVSTSGGTQDAAAGKDLIVISSSVAPGVIDAGLFELAVPVLTWENELYDDLLMSPRIEPGGGGEPYGGGKETGTAVTIVAPAHPCAAGFPSGTVSVLVSQGNLTFGDPSADATVIATTADGNPALFVFDAGATLVDAMTEAPARRVGFFLPEGGSGELTTEGLMLLEAALNQTLAR
jgi:hypothetical protein